MRTASTCPAASWATTWWRYQTWWRRAGAGMGLWMRCNNAQKPAACTVSLGHGGGWALPRLCPGAAPALPCPPASPCRDANVLVFCAPHQFIHRMGVWGCELGLRRRVFPVTGASAVGCILPCLTSPPAPPRLALCSQAARGPRAQRCDCHLPHQGEGPVSRCPACRRMQALQPSRTPTCARLPAAPPPPPAGHARAARRAPTDQ